MFSEAMLGRQKVIALLGAGVALVVALLVFFRAQAEEQTGAPKPETSSSASSDTDSTITVDESDKWAAKVKGDISALFVDPALVKEVRIEALASSKAIVSEAGITLSTGSTQDIAFTNQPSSVHAKAYDVTTVVVQFDAGSASCLHLSDMHFSTKMAQRPNDGVIIGLGPPTWQLDDISRQPLATQGAQLISLQTSSVFNDAQLAQNRTPLLEAELPLGPETRTFYISVFDDGDAAGNVALSLGRVSLSQDTCDAGFKLSDASKMVALGDSYTSGFGVGPFESGTGGESGGNNCQRATRAYPVLLAEMKNFELTSVACQGAYTTDLLGENISQNESPQLDAVGIDTGLVVLTLGGNDTGWFTKLPDCVVSSVLGPSCAESQAINDDIDATFGQLGRIEKNLNESVDVDEKLSYQNIVREIRRRSPFSTIVIVTYPLFFPREGAVDPQLEFVGIKRCAGVLVSDQKWINQRQEELKTLLRNAVIAEPGVMVVDSTATFQGHELCSSDPWLMNVYEAGPFHPNAEGHQAIADLVAREIADS